MKRSCVKSLLEELEYEPSLDATHIGVAVEKGVVTLTGHVANFAQKQAAIAAVRRVKGVRAVADEVEVRYPFDQKIGDDEIAKRAVDILSWNSVLPDRAIQVLPKWLGDANGRGGMAISEAIRRR